MESWAEISGRSLSCRHGARWDLEQVFFLFQQMVSDLQRSTIIDFISSLLLLLLFSLVVSEEDSEKMRKNNNINKRSDAPSDFILSGKNYSEGVNVAKR